MRAETIETVTPEIVSTTEAAELLQINVQTVRRYCRKKVLVTVNTSVGHGKGVRYGVARASLTNFMQTHRFRR